MRNVRLMPGELWSEKYQGMIERPEGWLRMPYVWVDKNGKERRSNRYLKISSCSVCGKETLKDKSNMRGYMASICSKACVIKKRTKPDGSLKRKRGPFVDSHIMVKSSSHPHANRDGFIAEHRHVMEKKLGRFLSSKEQVHHINLLKDDNREENLIVFSSHSEHFKSHGSLNLCVAQLMERGVLSFDRETKTYKVV